jgi:hypothetical protein
MQDVFICDLCALWCRPLSLIGKGRIECSASGCLSNQKIPPEVRHNKHNSVRDKRGVPQYFFVWNPYICVTKVPMEPKDNQTFRILANLQIPLEAPLIPGGHMPAGPPHKMGNSDVGP